MGIGVEGSIGSVQGLQDGGRGVEAMWGGGAARATRKALRYRMSSGTLSGTSARLKWGQLASWEAMTEARPWSERLLRYSWVTAAPSKMVGVDMVLWVVGVMTCRRMAVGSPKSGWTVFSWSKQKQAWLSAPSALVRRCE